MLWYTSSVVYSPFCIAAAGGTVHRDHRCVHTTKEHRAAGVAGQAFLANYLGIQHYA